MTAAWSGLYMLLASRRKHRVLQRFTPRGFIRGGAMGMAALNVVAGGVAYVFGPKGRSDKWIGQGDD